MYLSRGKYPSHHTLQSLNVKPLVLCILNADRAVYMSDLSGRREAYHLAGSRHICRKLETTRYASVQGEQVWSCAAVWNTLHWHAQKCTYFPQSAAGDCLRSKLHYNGRTASSKLLERRSAVERVITCVERMRPPSSATDGAHICARHPVPLVVSEATKRTTRFDKL